MARKAFGMLERQMQADAPADRTADQDRLVQFERAHDLQHHGDVLRRGELVLLLVPARRRRGFAVPGHVEGDDAMLCRHPRIVHQAAILPAVAAGGVQAQQRRALARLLDIDAMRPAEQIEMHVAADDRARTAGSCGCSRAQLGERFLEVAQVRHEDLQIALGLQHAPLDQRQHVVASPAAAAGSRISPIPRPPRAAKTTPTASRTVPW